MRGAIKEQGHFIAAALSGSREKQVKMKHQNNNNIKSNNCFRCGEPGHIQQNCSKTVWCHTCNSDTHATAVCR